MALRRCLAALSEELGVDELLIVDNDGPRPDERELARAVGARYVVEAVRGSGPARNRGLWLASGDLVAFVDDDCLVAPGALGCLVSALDGRVRAAGGRVLTLPDDPAAADPFSAVFPYSRGERRLRLDGGEGYPGPLRVNELATGALMAFHRVTLCEVGGFPETLSGGGPAGGGEDLAAFEAIARAGYAAAYVPEALAYHPPAGGPDEAVRRARDYGAGYAALLTRALLSTRDPRAALRYAAVVRWYGRRWWQADPEARPLLRAHLLGLLSGPGRYLEARRVYV